MKSRSLLLRAAAGAALLAIALPAMTMPPGFDRRVEEAMRSRDVPGMAIAVVYRDEVVYLKGFGVRDTTDPQPVDPDTVFQLASLSKPIASTVVSSIVSDGLATWDDPLIKHDPGFALSDPWVTSQVTLKDMFAHRSGLPGSAGEDLEDVFSGMIAPNTSVHPLAFALGCAGFADE